MIRIGLLPALAALAATKFRWRYPNILFFAVPGWKSVAGGRGILRLSKAARLDDFFEHANRPGGHGDPPKTPYPIVGQVGHCA